MPQSKSKKSNSLLSYIVSALIPLAVLAVFAVAVYVSVKMAG